jgi:type IV pilus assembly protein PilB
MRIPDSLVERLLSSSKHASAKQLSALRKHELKDKKTLQDLAISNKLITEKELTRLYAKNIRVPFVELQADEINNEALQRLPERIARKYRSIVFADNDDGSLRLAMDDPKNIEAKRFLQKQLGAKLTIYVATSSALQAALDHYSISTETAALTNPLTLNQKFDEPIKESDLLDSSAAAQTVTALINHALDDDASDIHIEPRENFIVIRFRIDGLLREVVKLPRQSLAAVIGRIKFISNLSTEIHKTPQDGVFSIERKAKSYVLHVSILPILEGEKAVIKIRHESPSATDFTSLGLWGNALNNLHHAIVQPHGLILVTGPVGSGKATTLFSILSKRRQAATLYFQPYMLAVVRIASLIYGTWVLNHSLSPTPLV